MKAPFGDKFDSYLKYIVISSIFFLVFLDNS